MILSMVGLLHVIAACSALLVYRRKQQAQKRRRHFMVCLEKALAPPLRYTLSE
jgi:hypothetical protein